MTTLRKTGNTRWYIGGGIVALMMIFLAESSTPPRNEAATSIQTPYKKDFRPILQNIKTIPEHLLDEKAGHQTLLVKGLSGVPTPASGPMAALSQMEEIHTPYLGQFDITAVEVPATWDADWLIEIIEQDPSVKYAYKEPKMQPFSVWPNDPAFEHQINLHDPDHGVDIDAPEAWAYTTGSDSVIIAIFENGGLDVTPDLLPNLWVNSSETAGLPSIDDDNNGCIDDIHGCYLYITPADGRIFVEHDSHGRDVSSILARGNNAYALAGVTWNTRIMYVRGSTVRGLQYVMDMRDMGVNVRVVNNSRGNEKSCNPNVDCDSNPSNSECNIQEQIRMAGEKGILFVQAIGNSNINYAISTQNQISPGCLKTDNMIVVAGQSESSRTRWVYSNRTGSNYGADVGDLYAPTEKLHYLTRSHHSGYLKSTVGGTSLAAPHVAGAAALLWSFKPDLTVTQVRSALLDTVDRFPNYEGEVASGGALNIANALYSVATPGIRIHSSQTTIAEGTSGYIDLSLTREPVRPSSGEVVVLEGDAIMLSGADAVVTPSTLTFTSANWHIPQRMTVRAAGTSGSEVMLEVTVNEYLSTTHYRGIRSDATMTLQSDGIRPTLHIPARVAEGDITTATIRFSDPLISTAQFTIAATGDSTAAEGENYTLPGPITATPGDTSATFTIQTIEEPGYNGPDKTIHLQINTDNPHILREELPLQATLTIEDKDTPIMTISVFPRTIAQSNNAALAPTATATIQLDRRAVSDVRVLLNARTSRRGGDISHLFNNLSGNIWPASATITENATSTEIIIHSLDYDNDLGPSHWIRLSPSISDDAAARLGEPRWATLRTRDDDGDSDTYIRLRVFLEGAIPSTPVDTTQASP